MRIMDRNSVNVWYALYESDSDITAMDEWGNVLMTGEHKIKYSDPVLIKASVSPASGEAQIEMFGTQVSYSRVMIVSDPKCPIDENAILWVTKEPEFEEGSDRPIYEYSVVAVARSLNHVSYALREREVS